MGRARAFGLVAEEYERGRPGYAAGAIRWVLGDRLPEARAVEGTAKETGLPDACADAVVAGALSLV